VLGTPSLPPFSTHTCADEDRWAAKEAAFKAGGGGIGRRLQWKEVEVRYLSSGKTAREGEGKG